MSKKTKISLVILIVLVIAGYFGLKAYAAHVAEQHIDQTVSRVSGFVNLDYQKVNVDLFGLNTHIRNVRVAGMNREQTVEIDDIVIYRFNRQDRMPSSLHVRFNGINVPLDQLGQNAAALRQMGYAHIKADTEIDYTYDPAERSLDIHSFHTGAADLGHIKLTGRIHNLNLNPANLPILLFTFPNILVDKASVTYRDDSFVKRLLEMAAQERGQSYDAFIRGLNDKLEMEMAGQSDPFLKQVTAAVKRFLNDPGAITIAISPDEPVSIGRLQKAGDPDELIKLLNVTAYVD
jgi:hypothetical protein